MKLAVVTAGFHRLGAVIATRLAREGWSLALHSRIATEADDSLRRELEAQRTEWHGFHADLSDPDAVEQLMPAIAAHFGRAPDLLVNNASLFEWDNCESVSPQALSKHMAINMQAPVLLATALAQHLEPGQQASIINILDQRICQPNGDQLSYTLSKQALAGATETLARALAPSVRVNGVAPGLVIPTADYSAAQMDRVEKAMPLDRLPTPGDIADAVLYFAKASAVTGQIMCVDGGAHMKSFARDFLFI